MASLYTETLTGITTVFTPPASCSSSFTYEAQGYNSVKNGLLIQNVNAFDFDESCFPSGFEGYGRAPSMIQVYSPGVCPSGYATPGMFNDQGTTTAICCQSGYSYGSTYSSINYFGTTSVLYMGCISQFSGTGTFLARANNTGLTETVVTGPITLWAQPITMEFQQKDLSLFTTSTSSQSTSSQSTSSSSSAAATSPSSGSSSSGRATSAGSSSSSSSTPSPLVTKNAGLSTGAKAGIGVGVAIVVLALIGLGVFFIMRHRKKRFAQPPEYYGTEVKESYHNPDIPQELPGAQSYGAQAPRTELEGESQFAQNKRGSGVKRKPVAAQPIVSELE